MEDKKDEEMLLKNQIVYEKKKRYIAIIVMYLVFHSIRKSSMLLQIDMQHVWCFAKVKRQRLNEIK